MTFLKIENVRMLLLGASAQKFLSFGTFSTHTELQRQRCRLEAASKTDSALFGNNFSIFQLFLCCSVQEQIFFVSQVLLFTDFLSLPLDRWITWVEGLCLPRSESSLHSFTAWC